MVAHPVLAKTGIDAKLTANAFELKANETLEVTFSFTNFREINKGINAYKGTLEYDKNIFEEVVQSDFESLNNWEELKYNPQNGQFVAFRKVGTKTEENVVKLVLKVKKDVEATKTIVKIKDITTSEGKKDIFLSDANLNLNIIKEQIVIPSKPSTGGTINNSTNTSGSSSGNKIETSTPTNPDNTQEKIEDITQNEKPSEEDKGFDVTQDETTPNKETTQGKKTSHKFTWILICIFIQLIAIIVLYIKHKEKDKSKSINLSLIVLGIILTEFIGITSAYAYDFSKKGQLNGDSEINYADVSLLELHLIQLKNLPDDKLEFADMNMDGKITITDLTVLIQKIEKTLEYDAEIVDIDIENAFPNKNQEISVKLNADVSYGASIKRIVMNNQEYEVEKEPNTSFYTLKINAGSTARMRIFTITEARLDNDKKVKMNYTFKIDVLKDKPMMENYRVEENKDDSKLILLFNIKDDEDSLENAYVEIYDETQNLLTQEKVVKGENRIEVSVEEKKEYKANIILNYKLSNDPNDETKKGVELYEKDLQLLIDYHFTFGNLKTYKEDQETTIFSKEDQVKLVFESSNSTKHNPKTIKIGEKEYEVVEENGKFIATLDAVTELGNQTIQIDEITLSNGKRFAITENNTITIQVNKRKPEIIDLSTTEFTEMHQLKVMFKLEDLDEAVTELNLQVLDANDNEIGNINIPRNEVLSDGMVNKFFPTHMTTAYKVKIHFTYNLTGNDADTITNELAEEKTVEADPRITIKSITPSSNYVKKGEIVKLTFDLESNKTEDITRILINNINCIAVKLDNGNYEATLNVGGTSGIYPFNITKFTYSNGAVATTDETIQVEVLKDKPVVKNFAQTDNLNAKEVILRFDVEDEENTFLSGKAILTSNGVSIEKAINKGHNELTFQVEPSKKYTLKINATYDLDSNTLEGTPEEDNRITDETLATQEVELIADYQLDLKNIKTYNENGETKYFGKSEPITISFESTNSTTFEPIKAVVNGKEYPLTKKENAYYLTISSHRTSGVKTAKIEKIILSNSKELIITENNEIKVTVLKDKPTIEQFGYKENMDATISASFKVIDEEETITNGKVFVLKNGAIVKEQTLEKNDNTITFQPEENQNYIVKVIADYDLDMNVLEEDANEYKNVTLLEADITLGARKFEMKDIIRTSIYKQTADGVVEVKDLSENDLTNLDNYIAKVYLKQMPTFYTKITGYRIEDNQLKLTLDFDNVVQYSSDNKQDKLEIVFGEMNNGIAENITLEGLIREMEKNPNGTFTLTRDYDASIITKNTNTLISSFTGTLNGNGHKIYNLSKPLFDTLESATIENLILESPKLSGVNSRGTLANSATNTTIRNVHVKDLTLISGTNRVGGILGEATSSTIEQSSVTNFKITTSLHIRIGGIVGNMIGGAIKNCYVEGDLNSTQNKDGNGISGILGTGDGTELITIENCLTKVTYTNNVSARLNGDIVGLALNNNTALINNVSLSTGSNFYSIHGSTVHATSTNNYELANSGLVTNASGNRVKQVTKEELTTEFFKNNVNFDETIWDISDVSYDKPPVLQVAKATEETTDDEKPSNSKLYIPDYTRIKKINGYTEEKDILYHNINKLMPYYDAKYLIEDGLKLQNDHLLNAKIIKHILPYRNGKLQTYLTSQSQNSLTSIKVVFEDYSVQEYNLTYQHLLRNHIAMLLPLH